MFELFIGKTLQELIEYPWDREIEIQVYDDLHKTAVLTPELYWMLKNRIIQNINYDSRIENRKFVVYCVYVGVSWK